MFIVHVNVNVSYIQRGREGLCSLFMLMYMWVTFRGEGKVYVHCLC